MDFLHLHCHTQYSLLDGANHIPSLMEKAAADGQKGVAITDHGNMFGVFQFVAEAKKHNVKPLVGCEFYLVEDRHKRSFLRSKGERDRRYHQLLLAKNPEGYKNLSKLCSLGFIEGLYDKFPRIDKELLLQYSEGLIATSCCIGAELPQTIIHQGEAAAEEKIKWWIDLFGDDFYIEIQRQKGLENIDQLGISQEDVNQALIRLARKFDLKIIATNDAHYLNEEDYTPHDILLCINTQRKVQEENRFKFSSSDYYFKTKSEMQLVFKDIPEALDNTIEVYDKITAPELEQDILLPNFPLPEAFKNQKDYLRHQVFEGAKVKYKEITAIVEERLNYELKIIDDMGFNGYFLITQDFVCAARDLGVAVGPGRGSAAGSAVAFCLTITNVDPIKYNLLFERFLNPERISMPDIDIDFDDTGRQKVIDYVVDKYGQEQVAQIVTFGKIKAKSSIRDIVRVNDLPISEGDRLANLVPTRGIKSLNKVFNQSEKEIKEDWNGDDLKNIQLLRQLRGAGGKDGELLSMSERIEGAVRSTGIHAAGVIIAPSDIKNHIPVCTSKESNLLITQFDGDVIERAGMLKMDFLGLKTLSIIRDAILNVVDSHGEEARIDPDEIPLDDEKTYELFQRGETIGIFQFESTGMRKHMHALKPTNIEDIIAMNALYRPGPMDYIPLFISRKHGKAKIEYPHEMLTELLKPTYGIMVYQEQIMQCAQIIGGFSLGKADVLRRAMGKKKKKEMDAQKIIFVEGAEAKGIEKEKAEEIFSIMEKFASYGFNRSHAAAYSILAFQTTYLKAHHPAEFMASILSHNKNDIKTLNMFLRECKRMKLKVLGPDVNESKINFAVNKDGDIRFGLSALKGIGEGPSQEILDERIANGPFQNVYDMLKRLSSKAMNKKTLETLVTGGALDSLHDKYRSQYFAISGKYPSFIEHLVKFAQAHHKYENTQQNSLFGETMSSAVDEPQFPEVEKWSLLELLTREKEVAGIYLSGHPLDDYRLEIENYVKCSIDQLPTYQNQKVSIAGIVTSAGHLISKKGTGYGRYTVQDYNDSLELLMFTDNYLKFKEHFFVGNIIYMEGSYTESRRGNGEMQFNVSDVKVLDSIAESKTKSITVRMKLSQLDESMTKELQDLIENFAGKHRLKLYIQDTEEDVSIVTLAAGKRVNASEDFIHALTEMGLEYKLN